MKAKVITIICVVIFTGCQKQEAITAKEQATQERADAVHGTKLVEVPFTSTNNAHTPLKIKPAKDE